MALFTSVLLFKSSFVLLNIIAIYFLIQIITLITYFIFFLVFQDWLDNSENREDSLTNFSVSPSTYLFLKNLFLLLYHNSPLGGLGNFLNYNVVKIHLFNNIPYFDYSEIRIINLYIKIIYILIVSTVNFICILQLS